MKNREETILEAAIQLFMRYGVKRTGMNDIAAEAGIARQTLYNAFPNKDAVLQAVIRLLADRVIADIKAGLETTDDLEKRLDLVLHHIAVEHYDLLHTSPNAEDIVAGFNASSQDELEAGAQRNIELICRILEPYSAEIKSNALGIEQVADFIQRTATAAKYSALDRKHLLDQLTVLKASVLKITGVGQSR